MQFENTGIEGTVVPFPDLEQIMTSVGIIRGGSWDWERVTYDFKFENHSDGSVYYLRVPGIAVESEIERRDCKVELKTPYVGRHYYPHGVEYDEDFPDHVINTSKERLALLAEAIKTYKENA
ncbi:YugN family protein [Camelliibacillus cellulosilyticus]|uniref:YugN family protein n=1 Tax=Camelliibacillus cellulosilyticus TaxID=2174486 RepID=A0ABV9GJ99_9BACL